MGSVAPLQVRTQTIGEQNYAWTPTIFVQDGKFKEIHLPKYYTVQVKGIFYDSCGRHSDSQDVLQCWQIVVFRNSFQTVKVAAKCERNFRHLFLDIIYDLNEVYANLSLNISCAVGWHTLWCKLRNKPPPWWWAPWQTTCFCESQCHLPNDKRLHNIFMVEEVSVYKAGFAVWIADYFLYIDIPVQVHPYLHNSYLDILVLPPVLRKCHTGSSNI